VLSGAKPRASDVVLVLGHGPGIGLLEAAARSRNVIGVDPSELMREVARRRCADLIGQGRVRLEPRDAAGTGEPDASGDVALAVNDVIWPDRSAGFAELHRVLRRPHAAVRAPEISLL
jgi:arsenite methyltransferase